MADTPPTVIIPTIPGRPYYTTRTRLDEREYNLRFAWNERTERWHFDLLSANNEDLMIGVKLVTNWPMLRFYKYDDRIPPGELIVVALSSVDGNNDPPGLYDLGEDKRCVLTYYPVISVT